jgi:hypothetical protein
MTIKRLYPAGYERAVDITVSVINGTRVEVTLDSRVLNKTITLDIIFLSPGVIGDGGGFIIVPGGVIPVPPWEPRITEEIIELATLATSTRRLAHQNIQQAFEEQAIPMIGERTRTLIDEFVLNIPPIDIGRLKEANRATVVVI